MKYIIFLYLLFEFINSKELKYRFGIPKALIRNYNTIIKESEETEVCQAETKAQCIAIKNPSEDAICCFSQIKMAGITIIQACSDFPKELLSFSDLFETKEFKAYLREEYGYQIYSQGQEMPEVSTEIKVTCKDGQFSMALFEKAYSDKEKKIFLDDNHCLNINAKKLDNYKYDVGECKEGLVTDNSKSNKIECGTFIYNILLKNGTTINYKTCNLFNLKIFSQVADLDLDSLLDEEDNDSINGILNSMEIYDGYIKYTSEAYNSKGQKVTFDSETKQIIVEGSANLLIASKFLLLLILFLF